MGDCNELQNEGPRVNRAFTAQL